MDGITTLKESESSHGQLLGKEFKTDGVQRTFMPAINVVGMLDKCQKNYALLGYLAQNM